MGGFFGDLIKRNTSLLDWTGRFSGGLIILGVILFLVGRLVRRRMILKELAAARLEPENSSASSTPANLSLSSTCATPGDFCPTPSRSPAHCTFRRKRSPRAMVEIPRDRDIVLFCTCPSEATAAKTAMALHKLGIERVRPCAAASTSGGAWASPSTP